MPRRVDKSALKRWRELDVLDVLARVGCYWKVDPTFDPVTAVNTERVHVNAAGVDFELLVTGPKFFDTRAQKGGGGAIDLVMHVFALDFKSAVRRLTDVCTTEVNAICCPNHGAP